MRPVLLLALASLLVGALPAQVPGADELPSRMWRPIGPANMGGRVTDLAVHPRVPSTYYLAAATGGVWKTTSAGARFEPVFDGAGAPASVGAVAVSAADPDIVWAGTGEANARNSASYGYGVWKSSDAGKTWKHVGLKDSRHIGRIATHPTDPDVAYVAALGRVWGANRMRGLYRTKDGGQSWSLVLALDENTGVIDVVVNQQDPNHVYAAAYEVRRDGFDTNNPAVMFGEKAGIYRSSDGGETWSRATDGLPSVRYGRIGLHLWGSDQKVVYAVVETELSGEPAPGSENDRRSYLGVQARDAGDDRGVILEAVTPNTAASAAGLRRGDLVTAISSRKVEDYEGLGPAIRAHDPGETVTISIVRDDQEMQIEATLGKAPGRGFPGSQGGQRFNVQDRQGPRGFETGGVFVSEDHGQTWKRINSLTPRPFYYSQIRVDPKDRSNMWVLGIQVNVSRDGGKTFRSDAARQVHPDHHAMWIDPADPRHMILGNDGGVAITWDQGRTWEVMPNLPLAQYYAIELDDAEPYRVYGGLQDNGTWVTPSDSDQSRGIHQREVFKIAGGDGFQVKVDPSDPNTVYAESQNGNLMRLDMTTKRTSRIRQRNDPTRGARFNWQTPMQLSPSNPHTLLFAGDRVFRSVNRGRTVRAISGDITRTDRGSATALAIAPGDDRVIWVGTDDGAIHHTRDGGANWTEVTMPLPGVGGHRWVNCIEISREDPKRVYVVLDGHRDDDFRAHVFVTEDGGASFRSIAAGLPEWHARVLREDPRKPDLLWLGTETGVWFSPNRGLDWVAANRNLPIVPVHDIRIHEREREVVLGTHGRGIWIADARVIQDLSEEILAKDLHFFDPAPARVRANRSERSRYGARQFAGERRPNGAKLVLWAAAEAEVKVTVKTILGRTIHTFDRDLKRGVNEIVWQGRRRTRTSRGIPFSAGEYTVTVSGADFEETRRLTVRPSRPLAAAEVRAGEETSR